MTHKDTKPEPIKIDDDQKKLIDEVARNDKAQVSYWTGQLELAKSQLKFWENQHNHSSALAMRATMERW